MMNFHFSRHSAKQSGRFAGTFERRWGFTLMEVMIAVAILFMCLFAVLALLSNSLRSARTLQQRHTVDVGSVAGQIYVLLANTNQVSEGRDELDLEDTFPGYRCEYETTEAGTNGLVHVDVVVLRRSDNQPELKTSFFVYAKNFKQGGLSGGLSGGLRR